MENGRSVPERRNAARPFALERAGAVAKGKCPNRENVIAQLIPCIRQVGKGQIGAKTPNRAPPFGAGESGRGRKRKMSKS